MTLSETTKPKILVVSRTFYPKEGGIEEYVYNRCLQDPEQVMVLSARFPSLSLECSKMDV
jgi:hypothetical protein